VKASGKKNKNIKRAIIGTSIAAIVAVGGWFCFKSMSGVDNTMFDIAKQNIGEARHQVRAAHDGGISIEFSTGMREENFVRNGIATKTVPFAMIRVNSDSLRSHSQIDGMLQIGEETHNITLLQNPYRMSEFAYDIIKNLNGREVCCHDQVTITLFIASNNHPTIVLNNTMTPECIAWDAALKLAVERLTPQLKGKTFEVHVTVTHSVATGADSFWYVEFVTECGQTFFCVISSDGAVIG